MNVRVALGASLRTGEAIDQLARIVQAIADGWHEWIGPDPADEALVAYFGSYRTHRELVEKAFARSALYPVQSRHTIVVGEEADVNEPPPDRLDSDTTVTLSAAAILLTEPLRVLVEHEINDGAFFSRLLRVVDEDLIALYEESRPRIRFDNGGGNAVLTDLIRSRAEAARAAGVPFRHLVLVDSDSRYPGHCERAVNGIRRACSETGASLFVLAKRAIENYVTDPVLHEHAADDVNVARSVAFILALPSEARDHYPIKSGIAAQGGKPDLPEGPEKQMYDGIEFPQDFTPKLRGTAARFVETAHEHTEQELAARDCLTEARDIALWMRGEL